MLAFGCKTPSQRIVSNCGAEEGATRKDRSSATNGQRPRLKEQGRWRQSVAESKRLESERRGEHN
jgi:hypothetical protein